jgi:hypothetical protein
MYNNTSGKTSYLLDNVFYLQGQNVIVLVENGSYRTP